MATAAKVDLSTEGFIGVPRTCKFCGVPITCWIHPDYMSLKRGDKKLPAVVPEFPQILELACCDKCSEAREQMRSCRHALHGLAAILEARPDNRDLRERLLPFVKRATHDFVRLAGLVSRRAPVVWEEQMADTFIAAATSRQNLNDVLARLWPAKPTSEQTTML